MRSITLTQGKSATIDTEDYKSISKFKWFAKKDGKNSYACRSIFVKGKGGTIMMHRQIMDKCPKGKEIDHIDGNGLNNRRSNLRIVSKSQNQLNAGLRIDNSSGFKGVSWDKRHKMWYAYARLSGKQVNLGRYTKITEAVTAYEIFTDRHYKQYKRKL